MNFPRVLRGCGFQHPQALALIELSRSICVFGNLLYNRQSETFDAWTLADAPVLVLDEATSSLDSESEALIQEAMERLMAGRTSIVIAHRLSTVRMLDRILVFDRGQVVEGGTHEELVRLAGGIYRRLFERQALGLMLDDETARDDEFSDDAVNY